MARLSTTLFVCSFPALALALSSQAIAQSARDTGAAPDESRNPPEILVTAQKRAERLTDVPVSIAAISSAQMKATGAQRVSELAAYVPNVAIVGGDVLATQVTIRGVGSTSRNIGFDTRVGVYLDGVYLGQSPAIDQELLGLDHVEVLRGPQGALFGKNTVAGAINLITERPSDQWKGQAVFRTGNLDLLEGQARISGPIVEGIDAGVSVSKISRGGYTNDIANGQTLGDRDALSYRGQLLIKKIDNLQIYATVDGLRGHERPYLGNPISDTFGVGPDTVAPGPYEVSIGRTNRDRRNIFGTSLEIAYDLPNRATIKSISSYRYTGFHTVRDVDGSALDILYVDYQDRYKQYTEELQYISPTGGRLEYVGGLYYFQQHGISSRDAIAGALGGVLGMVPGTGTTTGGTVDTYNIAAYGNATYHIFDSLKLGVGFRLSRETKKGEYMIDSLASPAFGLATGTFGRDIHENNFSPTATLTYEFDRNNNVYARYSEGYKSGGFNFDFVSASVFPNNISFGKETVRNYEIGAKLAFWNRRVTLNAALFRADYDNYQLDRYVDLGGGRTAITLTNAGKVRTQGFELEGAIRPSSSFDVHGGIGFLDPKFTDFPNADLAGDNYAGHRLPGASKFQATIGADLSRPVAGDLLAKASVNYSYRSGAYSDVANAHQTTLLDGQSVAYDWVKGYGLLDARIGVGGRTGQWEFALWGRNLTNRKYIYSYGREFLGTLFEYRGETRTYGLEASMSF